MAIELSTLGAELAEIIGPHLNVFVASEALSALRVVRLGASGHVRLARPPEVQARAPVGVTYSAAASGTEVRVCIGGELSDSSWNWTPGAPILLGIDGVLTQVQPPSLPYVAAIGVAMTSTTMLVRLGIAIDLA